LDDRAREARVMDRFPKPAAENTAPTRRGARPIVAAPAAPLPLRDAERLGALLTRLEPRLAATALRFTRDPDAARDVVQNAFEKVLRHGEKFRGDARVSTWIHRIVANEALMWLRAQRRRRETRWQSAHDDLPLAADGAPTPAEALERREQLDHLWHGLRELSSEEHDVMRCCALGGQSYAEYGGRKGIHPTAVKSRAFRARRHLAERLRE
jgi:RNA polymerase sigma-70 factor (ECF subfamily)